MAKNKKGMTPEERLAAALVPEKEWPYALPDGWKWVRTGALNDYKLSSITPSTNPDDAFELYSVPSIVNGYPEITKGMEIGSTKQLVEKDDVLLCKINPRINRVWKVSAHTTLKCLASSEWLVVRARPFFVSDYLMWFFRCPYFRKRMLSNVSGVGGSFMRAKSRYVQTYPVALPPLSEQHRLVARIESLFAKLDAAKAKVQAVLDAHEKRKAALLHEVIAGNLIGVGERELKPLSEIVDLIRIGPFGSALHKEDYIQDGIPVVNPQHIVNQVICPDSRKSISESKADSLAMYKMCANDIIIGRRGEMGRTAPVGEDEAGWLCGTGCMLLRLKKEYDVKFYSLVIASQKSKQYLKTHAVGSTMKNLNEKIIRNLPVPVYSYAEQQEIVAILDRLLGREEEVRQSAESVLVAIDSMKQSILARAFRGELGA
ncbi:restriction endonuclease subunit S [Mitsuokella sp. UBA4253]|uniref:restriction endonuclease subunit S n=1 Tax=Mitsuokella sp. UBA4253 TaxID=1946959 RepID=UPI00257DEB5B|nr:restriction endonuclease subunit S [Mitsuokella sp. UBA4253]